MNIHNNNVHHPLDIVHHYNMVNILNKHVLCSQWNQNHFPDIDTYNHQDNQNMYYHLNIYQFYLLNTHRHHVDIHFHGIV